MAMKKMERRIFRSSLASAIHRLVSAPEFAADVRRTFGEREVSNVEVTELAGKGRNHFEVKLRTPYKQEEEKSGSVFGFDTLVTFEVVVLELSAKKITD